MDGLPLFIGVALAVFAATDIDDLLVLSAFFCDDRLDPRAIVAGQYAGIAALIALSIVAARLALAIPEGWVALLGLIPLAIGLGQLVRRRRGGEDEDEAAEAAELRAAVERRVAGGATRRLAGQAAAIALVTIANGGDNLAVYIPLFASRPAAIPLYVAAFAAMTGLWCLVGYWLVNNPLTGERVKRYGHRALPYILIALGLYILSDALTLLG